MQLIEDIAKKFQTQRECAKYLNISYDHWGAIRNQRVPLSPRTREYIQLKLDALCQSENARKNDKKESQDV